MDVINAIQHMDKGLSSELRRNLSTVRKTISRTREAHLTNSSYEHRNQDHQGRLKRSHEPSLFLLRKSSLQDGFWLMLRVIVLLPKNKNKDFCPFLRQFSLNGIGLRLGWWLTSGQPAANQRPTSGRPTVSYLRLSCCKIEKFLITELPPFLTREI